MKRILVLLALATLVTGLLGSCKKDDIENPDPQSFEEVVKNLPGVYLTADYYDEFGYGRVVNLKEDGTTEQYYFFDNEVEDGVSVDEDYIMKGTWKAFKVEDIPSKTGFICNLTVEGDPDAEVVADTTYLFFNDKNYVFSTYFGYDEFFKVSQTFDEFKSKKSLEAFLPGHLRETELTKSSPATKSYTNPPEYLSRWMGNLSDDVYLCDLSIPGSHDALSYRCSSSAQTQTADLQQQFSWGIRFFDIRYCHERIFGRRVCPCHDKHCCMNRLRSLSDDLKLLEACVSMQQITSPKKEGAIIWLKCDQHMDDEAKTKWCMEWIKNNAINKSMYIPFRKDLKLGDIRGKIVVLTRSDKWNEWAGYHEPDPIKYIQDYCCTTTQYHLDEGDNKEFLKLKPIRFEEALYDRWSHSLSDHYEWLINHCSGYYKTYRPVEYTCDAYPELLNVLRNHDDKSYGIVPMDFVGRNGRVYEGISAMADIKYAVMCCNVYTQPLIEQIVKNNDKFKY